MATVKPFQFLNLFEIQSEASSDDRNDVNAGDDSVVQVENSNVENAGLSNVHSVVENVECEVASVDDQERRYPLRER